MTMLLPLFLLLLAAEDPAPRSVTVAPPKITIEEQNLGQLLRIRRIFVDKLTGGDTAAQIRDMILSSLAGTHKFVITENPEGADATLRGSAEDLVFTDVHNTSDNINARSNAGRGRGTTSVRDTRQGFSIGGGAGESESSRIDERKHEATASVRLVNKEGDLIWATTQESLGGKFRGSSADVADKITRRLLEDLDHAQRMLK